MHKNVQIFNTIQRHFLNILLSIFCMAAAAGISCVCSHIFSHNTISCTLIFVLSVILVSRHTASWLYGILCSCFAAFWLTVTRQSISPCCLADALCAAVIMIFSSFLVVRLAKQASLSAIAKQQLAEARTEKDRANLLRAISHDLRSPLTSIIGSSLTYLEHQVSLTDAEKEGLVRSTYDASVWLVKMVENLLAVTHINNHDLTICTREESVEEVVAEALQKTEKWHPGCDIHVSVPEDFIMLSLDAVLIEQVAVNLLENALVHSGSSTPIDFIVEDHPDCVSFTVRDYGNGIPKSKLEHLFENKDYTDSTTDGQRRMGIGLVICKTIITAHHGSITGRNHGSGAEFIFTLPKRKEEPHEFQDQYSSD